MHELAVSALSTLDAHKTRRPKVCNQLANLARHMKYHNGVQ
jgi:hypothetical protein